MPFGHRGRNKLFGDSIYYGHLDIPARGFKYKSLAKE
jgi:hypothetical protein